MIFLKPLVLQSKVICGSKQKTEDGFRSSIGNLIRSASWDASVDQTPFQKTTGVILPSILKKIPPVDQNGIVIVMNFCYPERIKYSLRKY